MFYVYVLEGKDSELYTGFTGDLKKRVQEHNQELNSSTKRYRPWKLIYYEASLSEIDAKRREGYLKTSKGRALLKRRLKEYLYSKKKKNLVD